MDNRQEERVLHFYKKSMADSLAGNVKEYLDSVGENAILIGSTQEEWMEGKSAVEERFKQIRAQITDNIDLRNRKLKILPVGSVYMVVDRSDVYVKIERNWNFAFQLRNTTLIEDIRNQLQIVLQHASVPDQSVNKEETLPFEKLKNENDRLEEAVRERTKQLEESLVKLKSTQVQLIQSEKMASLGELTAGIAHEIQNPLNFVNNFSDVSAEMIDEAFEEITPLTSTPLSDRIDQSEAIENVKDILSDLKGNLEKISHHGNRASSIVKGMLDHSRSSSDEKIPTDINALCDEYLRLSYHGLRAKDKSFNSGYETHFDDSIPLINVVPQDIGRVLLNIINNAFYACSARSAGASVDRSVSTDYKPLVTITTSIVQTDNRLTDLLITITDNGIGMSQGTIDKVFQPFFTTKPTGQGTGLGMSISYDIITKGHGGELKVESEEGKGSVFTFKLPISE